MVYGFGFTCVDVETGRPLKQQKGVFRTNCLDCLDRTNVFQSKVGALAFICQLQHLGVNLCHGRTNRDGLHLLEDFTNPLVVLFRKIWVNNGDNISFQYSGTTSTHSAANLQGKQTLYTLIRHGETSLVRKYRELSLDDWKHQNLELLVGETALTGHRRNHIPEEELSEEEREELTSEQRQSVLG